jgi:hypothetical protein
MSIATVHRVKGHGHGKKGKDASNEASYHPSPAIPAVALPQLTQSKARERMHVNVCHVGGKRSDSRIRWGS